MNLWTIGRAGTRGYVWHMAPGFKGPGSDDILRELDYTSARFIPASGLTGASKSSASCALWTTSISISWDATGRLLLKRPGYEIDIDRVIDRARNNSCFFEINSSPDRLDLSAENARRAAAAGVMIAINTDAHGNGELPLVRGGIDQARRAGLEKIAVLNCESWKKLALLFKR
jgi:DNA polymerase (family X)